MNFPEYMDFFTANYSPEFVEVLAKIESCLNAINYQNHIDIIDHLFMLEGTEPTRDLCDKAVLIYRTHIYDSLWKQGIVINNAEEDSLAELAQLLQGVVVLGVRKLEDIMEGDIIDEDDDEQWFYKLLSITSQLSVEKLMMLIYSVKPEVVDYLRNQETITDFVRDSSIEIKNRFVREMGENKEGAVVQLVRTLNHFPINPDTALQTLYDEIDAIKDPAVLKREIRLIIAGSDMRDPEKMVEWSNDALEHIKQDPRLAAVVSSQMGTFEDLRL